MQLYAAMRQLDSGLTAIHDINLARLIFTSRQDPNSGT